MKISKIARREAKQLFLACQVNGVLDDGRARDAVSKMISQKPRDYAAILSRFEKLVKLDVHRRSARVESAAPISAELRGQVQANLTDTYGPGLSFTFAENPALIGGLRVQVGSDVYDGSVQARLEALRQGF
jgi:F-type H+-transporting ATPase subunit delta